MKSTRPPPLTGPSELGNAYPEPSEDSPSGGSVVRQESEIGVPCGGFGSPVGTRWDVEEGHTPKGAKVSVAVFD